MSKPPHMGNWDLEFAEFGTRAPPITWQELLKEAMKAGAALWPAEAEADTPPRDSGCKILFSRKHSHDDPWPEIVTDGPEEGPCP